jgi:dTDP-4-dehydrorhamnose reductase
MIVLITGSHGLLGKKLTEIFKESGHSVYGIDLLNQNETNYVSLDITQQESVATHISTIKPDVVIHTAAYTDVDGCEKDKKTAYAVNVHGTQNLAESAEDSGAKFVYISTDYVFNGIKGRYMEDDQTDPIDYYGVTKLEGETVVKRICSNYIITRTSVLYGSNKHNFVTWIIDMLQQEKNIRIVTDQYVSPTLNIDLAEQLLALLDHDATGVFHTAGSDRISRYEFVKIIGDVFDLDTNRISPITMTDMQWIAPRPRDSSLDTGKISNIKKPFKVRKAVGLLQQDMGEVA